MLQLVNDLKSAKIPIVRVREGEIILILGLIPWEEGVVLIVPNVINALNPLAVQFMSPNISETIINKLKIL